VPAAVRATSRLVHGLVDHPQELIGQRVQVELLAQAGGEPLDGGRGVVAAPVESSVHDCLDAVAGRLEQGRRGQGGPGHRPVRRLAAEAAGQLPGHQHGAAVAKPQDDGEQPVDQGAVQQPVDVVEAIAQDRDPDGDIQRPGAEQLEQAVGVEPERADGVGDRDRDQDQPGGGEPLELLALNASGAVEPQRQGQGRGRKGGQEQLEADLAEGLDQPAQCPTGDADGVVRNGNSCSDPG
jgi:hypothetical protein